MSTNADDLADGEIASMIAEQIKQSGEAAPSEVCYETADGSATVFGWTLTGTFDGSDTPAVQVAPVDEADRLEAIYQIPLDRLVYIKSDASGVVESARAAAGDPPEAGSDTPLGL